MNAKLIFAMLALLFAQVANAQTIKTYNVSGSTADELIRSMRANSPQGFWAHTRNYWKYNYKYLNVNGSYELSELAITRTVEITMPNWVDYSSASRCRQRSWNAMYRSLKNHEERHVTIANPVSKALKRAIEAVGKKSSASALESAIDRAANSVFAQNRQAQALFDSNTNHGRTDPSDPVLLKTCA